MRLTSFVKQFMNRNIAYLLRWHHTPCTWRESLAEHQAICARMGFEISTLLLTGNGSNVRPAIVALAALYHDDPEIITGDTPSSLKSLIPGARDKVEVWEGFATELLWKHYPIKLRTRLHETVKQAALTEIEKQIVKYVDVLSAYAYTKDQVDMGNSLMKGVLDNFFKDGYFPSMNWEWLKWLRLQYEFP